MKRDIMYDDGINVKIYAIRDIENGIMSQFIEN